MAHENFIRRGPHGRRDRVDRWPPGGSLLALNVRFDRVRPRRSAWTAERLARLDTFHIVGHRQPPVNKANGVFKWWYGWSERQRPASLGASTGRHHERIGERDKGFEPSTFSLGRRRKGVSPRFRPLRDEHLPVTYAYLAVQLVTHRWSEKWSEAPCSVYGRTSATRASSPICALTFKARLVVAG